jgi:type IV fimbrial biogenesis protein FimT
MPHRPRRGLTLIELVVVLGIVALLMTLALPSFAGMLSRHRLKAAAEQLAMDLGELRLQAAQRAVPLHLDVQPGAQWCWALAVAAGCDCRVPQGCQMKTVRAQEHPGIVLPDAQPMRIDPQPGASRGAVLLQSADGHQLKVAISPLGRPKVCAPGGAVPGYPAC